MDGGEAELKVASLLQAMGFGLVGRKVKLLDSAGQAVGEIDSVFKCDRTLPHRGCGHRQELDQRQKERLL